MSTCQHCSQCVVISSVWAKILPFALYLLRRMPSNTQARAAAAAAAARALKHPGTMAAAADLKSLYEIV